MICFLLITSSNVASESVTAINILKNTIQGLYESTLAVAQSNVGDFIDDLIASSTKTYSSTKIENKISTINEAINLKANKANPTITGGFTEQVAVMPTDAIKTTSIGTYLTRALGANTTLTNSLTDGQSALYHFLNAGVTYTLSVPIAIKWVGGEFPTLTDDDFISFWMEGSQLWGEYKGTGIQV